MNQWTTLTMVPQLLSKNENWTLVPSDTLGLQFLSNRWVAAGFSTLLTTVDRSTITINVPLLEQTATKKKQTCHSHITGSHPPTFSGCVLTDVFREAEGTRLGKGSVDRWGFRMSYRDLKCARESLQSDVLQHMTLCQWSLSNIWAITFSPGTCSREWRAARQAAGSGCRCSWCSHAGLPVLTSGQPGRLRSATGSWKAAVPEWSGFQSPNKKHPCLEGLWETMRTSAHHWLI